MRRPQARHRHWSDANPGNQHVIAFASGKGGVGNHCAANLAVALEANGARFGFAIAYLRPEHFIVFGTREGQFRRKKTIFPIGQAIWIGGACRWDFCSTTLRRPFLRGQWLPVIPINFCGKWNGRTGLPGAGSASWHLGVNSAYVVQTVALSGAIVVTTPAGSCAHRWL